MGPIWKFGRSPLQQIPPKRNSSELIISPTLDKPMLLQQTPARLSTSLYQNPLLTLKMNPKFNQQRQIEFWISQIENIPKYTYILRDSTNLNQPSQFSSQVPPAFQQLKFIAHTLDERQNMKIFEIITNHIFHPVYHIPLSVLYSDMPCQVYINPESILNAEYSLFTSLIPHLEGKINISIIDKFFKILYSPAKKEQTLAYNVLLEIYNKFPQFKNYILQIIFSVITEFKDEKQYNPSIGPIFQFLATTFNNLDDSLPFSYFILYRNIFFPCVKSQFLPFFYLEFQSLMNSITSRDSSTALWSIRYLFKHWPLTSSDKQIIFLVLFQYLLSYLSLTLFPLIQIDLFKRIEHALVSPNFKVVLAAIKFLNREEITELFSPEIIENLIKKVQTLSNHWSDDVKNESVSTISLLNKLKDYAARKKNQNHQMLQQTNTPTISKWEIIIQSASENDVIDKTQTENNMKSYFKKCL